ncbi:MAG: peptidoglycan DD-metalloendopeptidase family protein [Mycobacterium leprae]
MKRNTLFSALLALTLTLGLILPAKAQAAGYTVAVNTVSVADGQAQMNNGQLMVAVRPLGDAVGAQVSWQAVGNRTTLSYHGSNLALFLGSHLAFQDGQPIWAPVAPHLSNGRLMAPAWWLAARLNLQPVFSGSRLNLTAQGAPIVAASHSGVAVPGFARILLDPSYQFPFAAGSYEPVVNDWGDPRHFDGATTSHEGTDVLAPEGTPIHAVAAGTVQRYGWNTLGGWRVNIQLDDHPGFRLYYAHLDHYAAGIYPGAHVQKGQVIGYVGRTGEGTEGHVGSFVPHLHFGIYLSDGTAINPYPFLMYWQNHS